MVKNAKKKAARAKRKAKPEEDLEDVLEDERLIAKLKKKSAKGKSDDAELFTTDTSGSGAGLPARTRRELARAKIFPPKDPRLGLSASEEALVDRAGKTLEALQARPRTPPAPEAYDLWAAKTRVEKLQDLKGDSRVRILPGGYTMPMSVPKTMYRTVSAAPAVVPAHEGQSINPLKSAYEEVACLAAARQLEREREEEEVERRMRPMTKELQDVMGEEVLQGMDEEAKVQAYRSLMCKGAGEEDAKDREEGWSGPRPVRNRQKSQSHRNNEKKRRILTHKQNQILAQRRLDKSVGSIDKIKKDLDAHEDFLKARAEYRKAHRAKKQELNQREGAVGRCRRIGRGRFNDPTVLVPDADFAGKGLRAMPARGHAAQERISSIISRGFLPPLTEDAGRRKQRPRVKVKRKLESPLLDKNLLLR